MPGTISADTADIVTRLIEEGPIGMYQAAKLMGTFRDGKPTHPTTVTRWARKGVKLNDGRVVKLENFKLNGRLATSKPALIRFIQAQQSPQADPQPPQPTPTQRSRAADAATAELDVVLKKKQKAS